MPESSSPIVALAEAIVAAAGRCAHPLKALTTAADEKERQHRDVLVLNEFLYFFLHLTNRHGYAYGESTGRPLQDALAPIVIPAFIQACFGHWPARQREGIQAE